MRQERSDAGEATRLSVVVPTRNVQDTVEECLTALLRAADSDRLEVIVVDNGSTDATLSIVRRFPVRLEVIPPGFVSRSRNVGAALAKHSTVAFVDSDCVVTPGWFDAILRTLRDASIGATGSRHVIRDDPSWVERTWDSAHKRRPTSAQFEVPYIPAGNLAVPRRLFQEIGGFDETLETGEDPDLCKRIAQRGLRIVEVPSIRCIHLGEPRTLTAVFRRERWHGRGVRARYADGRLAPITIATVCFAGSVLAALVGIGAAALMQKPGLFAGIALPLLVPAAYAARYARGRIGEFLRLLPIYGAYFLGRAAALPTVAQRALARGS